MVQGFQQPTRVERWGLLELAFSGRADGNPFTDYTIEVSITGPETLTIPGFYDGEGIYRVRFMPSEVGEYAYEVAGSFSDEVFRGTFTAAEPGPNNHGPVRVRERFHFAYADGTPYIPNGTTAYAFALQDDAIVDGTFEELARYRFNKLRFCFLPKHYDFSLTDPPVFPFEGTPMDASVLTRQNFDQFNGAAPGNHWDFARFNPAYFQRYDAMIARLSEAGVEADLILFHAYDRWGFSQMTMEENLRYLRYMVARYGAYRNIWWSLANEYELLRHLSLGDWETLAAALGAADPYEHLRSIHNCELYYDFRHPWITHCSCQREEHHKTTEFTEDVRGRFDKPVVWDEVGYEGDFPHCWGNFTPEELVRRAWEAAVRGGYCGHGETYFADDGVIWWTHGGRIHGASAARFAFLHDFLEAVPGRALKMAHLRDDRHFQWDDYVSVPEDPERFGEWYFFYYSIWRPTFRQIWIDDDTEFDVEVIDTWNMTITPAGRHKGRFEVPLPGNQYMGIRLTRVGGEAPTENRGNVSAPVSRNHYNSPKRSALGTSIASQSQAGLTIIGKSKGTIFDDEDL